MPKFTVRPELLVSSNGKDVSAAVNVMTSHNDNAVRLRVTQANVENGNLNGALLEIKAGDRMELAYDLGGNSGSLRFNSHVSVKDKRVDLIYRSALGGANSSLEAKLEVDGNNTAGVVYDLNGFNGLDHRNATLKWTHVRDDLELTPAYNLGSESLSVAAAYRVDGENRVKINYDLSSSDASLEWTNSSGTGGGGDLRVTARSNLSSADNAKQMPSLLLEKTWDVDA